MPDNDQTPAKTYQEIHQAFIRLIDIWRDFRTMQEKNYNYIIGDIVDDAVKQQLRTDNRPLFQFQIASQPMEYVAGKIKREAARMKAVPFTQGDEDKAKYHSEITNWAIGDKGYKEIAKSAIDAAIGKIGWMNNFWSMRDNPEGEYVVESADPRLVFPDPEGRQQDQSDWKYLAYAPYLSAAEIIRIYGKSLSDEQIEKIKANAEKWEGRYRDSTLPRAWFSRIVANVRSAFKKTSSTFDVSFYDDFKSAKDGLYRVVEWHDRRYYEKSVRYNARTRESSVVEDIPLDINPHEEVILRNNVEVFYITAICPALLEDDVLIEKPYPVQKRGFALKPVYFRKWHPDPTKAQSLMDRLRDPVDFHNQRMMTSLESAMDAVHPSIDAPDGSIEPENLSAWQSKERGVVRFYKNMIGMKPELRRPPTEAFQMLKVLAEDGKDLLEQCSGISPNARGYQESSTESGRLFKARSAQTEVMITDFMENVNDATKQVFKFCNRTLQIFMTTPRMIRLLNEENDPYWLAVNIPTIEGLHDITQGEYDFVPAEAVTGEMAKKENLAILLETAPLVNVDQPTAMMLASKVFKYMDIPDGQELSKFTEQRVQMMLGIEMKGRVQQEFASQMALGEKIKMLASAGQENNNEKHPLEKV